MKLNSIYVFCAIASFLLFPPLSFGQSITIDRKFETNECTQGYLYVDSQLVCYSLERADYSNSKNVSRIPLGTYSAFIRTDKKLGWRIELINVPNGRKHIEIHIGNYPFQTTGCILVGTAAKPENCTVQNSALAIDKLRKALAKANKDLDFDANSTQQFNIRVTFR